MLSAIHVRPRCFHTSAVFLIVGSSCLPPSQLLVLDDQLIYLRSSEVSNFFTNVAHLGHLKLWHPTMWNRSSHVEMSKILHTFGLLKMIGESKRHSPNGVSVVIHQPVWLRQERPPLPRPSINQSRLATAVANIGSWQSLEPPSTGS